MGRLFDTIFMATRNLNRGPDSNRTQKALPVLPTGLDSTIGWCVPGLGKIQLADYHIGVKSLPVIKVVQIDRIENTAVVL